MQFYKAFSKYKINDLDVLVVGSLSLWIECIVLSRKAKSVSTLDYNLPICDSKKINLVRIEDKKLIPSYDIICSFSSIEHNDLGIYGDPINPEGDIASMKEFSKMLREDGLLFLGIPISSGCIQGNLHRIYSKKRFKILIKDWDLIDVIPI
ncbi:MAG: DUF268 domain-containing protein [Promethearchaeota archaeon]